MIDRNQPDYDNVYGHVVAPNGLQPILDVVRRLIGECRASIKTSQFNGAETLRFSTDAVDFESTPLKDGSQHLLNGGVGGDLSDVLAFVKTMSRLLTEASIEHSFEVYDNESNLVQTFPSGQMGGPDSV